ncbi:MAG: hypothetical protein AB4911_19915 [Oscillochloridaceae bacterium umkhey_bin13]
MHRHPLSLIILLLLAACTPAAGPLPTATPPPLVEGVILGGREPTGLAAVSERQARIAAALSTPPYILQRDDLEPTFASAQIAALADERVQTAVRTNDGRRLRAEVLTVGVARAGDLPAELVRSCAPGTCARVVIYVHPTSTTITVVVAADGTVLSVQTLAGAQPEIPDDLAELAIQIAINDPQLVTAFDGLTPEAAMAAMAATKTALEGTACERSRHLCVAPVFVWGDQALWTIVDLTDFTLVAATTWTELGTSGRRVWSEATLQDAAVAPLCETPQTIEREGWQATYLLTSSDGLELRDVSYQGRLLIQSAKVVDWHVGYAGSNDQRVGFSDAVGCPVFSAAAVIPYGPPVVRDKPEGGFSLMITFRSPNWPQPCNYQYTFTAHFGINGDLTILAGNEGRGCGLGAIYHPIMRITPPEGTLEQVSGTQTSALTHEGLDEWGAGAPNELRVTTTDGSRSFSLAWGDAEQTYSYWTRFRPEEGAGDLPSIGTCCALDEQQGPEQFIGPGAPEPLDRQAILWFVPRLSNAERERCWADTTLVNGVLQPEVWPCTTGIHIRAGP